MCGYINSGRSLTTGAINEVTVDFLSMDVVAHQQSMEQLSTIEAGLLKTQQKNALLFPTYALSGKRCHPGAHVMLWTHLSEMRHAVVASSTVSSC